MIDSSIIMDGSIFQILQKNQSWELPLDQAADKIETYAGENLEKVENQAGMKLALSYDRRCCNSNER